MNKETLLTLNGDFTWNFGQHFLIETEKGLFVWSDPDYSGDNTIRPFKGTMEDFFGGQHGRDKGRHFISDYVGENFTYVE